MRRTRVRRPEGSARTSSPGRITAGSDLAGVAPEGLIGAQHALDGHAERRFQGKSAGIDGFQMLQQAGAGEPGHLAAAIDHVIAFERAQRQEVRIAGAGILQERSELGADLR